MDKYFRGDLIGIEIGIGIDELKFVNSINFKMF
jgi:hypothetical protein